MATLSREERKEKALRVLARLEEIRQAGAGSISAAEVFEMVGAPSDPAVHSRLEGRGPLDIRFESDGSGQFSNHGPAFSLPIGPAKLNVPPELGGTIRLDQNGAVFGFDPQRTLVARALLLELKLQRIEISDHHIALRLPGGMFDQEYHF